MNLEFDLADLKEVNLKYWINARKPVVMAVVGVLVALMMIFLMVIPQIQEMISIQQDIVAEEKKVAALRQKILALEQASTLPIVEKADQINDLLPSKKPLLEMLTSLNSAAEETDVTFTNIEVAPGSIATESAAAQPAQQRRASDSRGSSQAQRSQKLDLRVTVEGELDSINNFLETIELKAPFSNVTDISLNERRLSASNLFPFEAELVITTYYFTQPIVAAVEAPLPNLDTGEEAFINEIDNFQFPVVTQETVIRGGGLNDLFGSQGLTIEESSQQPEQ